MRKDDIIITPPTTEGHSTIYAYGTQPMSSGKPYLDPNDYAARSYVPAYVLAVGKAYVTILVADSHPDHRDAKRTLWNRAEAQASLLDALDYTLADHEARQKVLAKYSHWAEAKERKARDKALAKLKPLPSGWSVRSAESTYVRMLWAEYQERLDQAQDARATKAAAEEADKQARKDRMSAVEAKFRAIPGFPEDEMYESKNGSRGVKNPMVSYSYYGTDVVLDVVAAEFLLELLEKTKR